MTTWSYIAIPGIVLAVIYIIDRLRTARKKNHDHRS